MMTKTAFLAVLLPLTFSTAFAKVQMIPLADEIIAEAKNPAPRYIFKNVGGIKTATAIAAEPANWFNLSPADGIEGVRSEEAYSVLDAAKGEEIIVAVVDSGVDVNHEDLQGKIWINSDEIANNGLDDDGNGYIDDVFGWNFIGGSDGMASIDADASLKNGIRLVKGKPEAQIEADTLEVTRELLRLKRLKNRLEEAGEVMTPAQAALLEQVQKLVNDARTNAQTIITTYTARKEQYKRAEAVLKAAGVETMTVDAVRAVESSDPAVMDAKKDMLALLTNGLTEARIETVLGRYNDELNFYYNEEFNPRPIVKDNYADQNERAYGNNDVIGPDSFHGTHVAGIIAADRANEIGVKGVATNVKIMAVRVVPNGDERDKDVANGIRYAVDNGSKIINMSFGKAFSPYKGVVDEAVRYAASKGVLLMHAAGNDSKNNDLKPSYPMARTKSGEELNNWLEVCATGYQKGLALPATFTNFGKKTVDICAPGVKIMSTIPDNGYGPASGTSMATPAAAGVAALVLSLDPSMEADALKALLVDTGRRHPKLQVNLPGTQTPVLFSTLSTYGSIVDSFEAIKNLK